MLVYISELIIGFSRHFLPSAFALFNSAANKLGNFPAFLGYVCLPKQLSCFLKKKKK
jgi:hypothetical protein